MRAHLPYRKTTDGFLIYKGELLVKDFGHYLHFVGGGLDPGEDAIAAQIRETKEETGAILSNVRLIADMQWVWPLSWANTLKRKERYARFQGEHIYFLTGLVEGFVEPTGNEEDKWGPITTLSWEKVIELAEKYYEIADHNTKVYKCYQMVIIKTLAALYAKPIN